jgi:hypothetical protein
MKERKERSDPAAKGRGGEERERERERGPGDERRVFYLAK